MKTLVTGANGLLGSNVVRELLRRGHEVRVLVRANADLRTLRGLGIDFFEGDLADEKRLIEACRDCDFVIHAAGKTAGKETAFSDYAGSNIGGTQRIVRAAKKAAIRRMVYVSSCCVFSGGTLENPGTELSEFTGFRYNSGYINSKYLALQWVLSEVERSGFPIVSVNPTLMLGPYDSRPSSGEAILHVLRHNLQPCPTGGKNFVDVRDAAMGTCNALSMGIPGECYLLAGENLSFTDFYAKVDRIYGRPPRRISMPGAVLKGAGLAGNIVRSITRHNISLNYVNACQLATESYFSGSKAARNLDFPLQPVDSAIEDAINWFIENGFLAPRAEERIFVPVAA